MPRLFDMTAYYEPSAHFQASHRIRSNFDGLARDHYKSTWLIGKYGGKARMQTDIKGIGVATRVEIGRLALSTAGQQQKIHDAFELFQKTQEIELASGPIDRILVNFNKADRNATERGRIQQAYAEVFAEGGCNFLLLERDLLELGHCVEYQTLVEYMRQDGLYHSAYRDRLDKVQKHLQKEVGRYENFTFYVRPEAVEGDIPRLQFCYTGDHSDSKVEAFMEAYAEENPLFVSPEEFQARREEFVDLEDYERASRRFGGIWALQRDIVRFLPPACLGGLYLFFDQELQPELERSLSWVDLFARQRSSPYINRASRNSQTFLEIVLERLVRHGFVEEKEGFRLSPGFQNFKQVSFEQLGEHRRRH
jgi:hypothetical protein